MPATTQDTASPENTPSKSSKKKKSKHKGKKGKAEYKARRKERRARESGGSQTIHQETTSQEHSNENTMDKEYNVDWSTPDPNNIWTHSAYKKRIDHDSESISDCSDQSFKAHQDDFIQQNRELEVEQILEEHEVRDTESFDNGSNMFPS